MIQLTSTIKTDTLDVTDVTDSLLSIPSTKNVDKETDKQMKR